MYLLARPLWLAPPGPSGSFIWLDFILVLVFNFDHFQTSCSVKNAMPQKAHQLVDIYLLTYIFFDCFETCPLPALPQLHPPSLVLPVSLWLPCWTTSSCPASQHSTSCRFSLWLAPFCLHPLFRVIWLSLFRFSFRRALSVGLLLLVALFGPLFVVTPRLLRFPLLMPLFACHYLLVQSAKQPIG